MNRTRQTVGRWLALACIACLAAACSNREAPRERATIATQTDTPPATAAAPAPKAGPRFDGLEQYCRDAAQDSALFARYELTPAGDTAEARFDQAANGHSPAALRVQEQHGQIQGIWLDWGTRAGVSRSEMARTVNLPLLAGAPDISDELDYKTEHIWQVPTDKTASIHVTCAGKGERDRCYKLYLECVEYYD